MARSPNTDPLSKSDILLHAPYPEKAVLAIAQAAQDFAHMRFASTSRAPSATLARAFSLLRGQNQADRLARGHKSVSGQIEMGAHLDVVRLLMSSSRNHNLQRNWMYLSSKLFDSLATSNMGRPPKLYIGMPGATLTAFRQLSDKGAMRVFHSVNAHPQTHNEVLRTFIGRDARQEEIPKWMVERQESELHEADIILTPSHLVSQQMVDHGIKLSKIVQIPYGTWSAEWQQPDFYQKRTIPRVLFVGQISYRKGLSFLINAARRSTVEVIMVGPIVSRKLVKNLPSNVKYIGPLPASKVAQAMKNCDAFILPTLEDACALVTLEAATLGLPVITTSANGASTALPSIDQTILAPGDELAIVGALNAVEILSLDRRQERASRLSTNKRIRPWQQYGHEVLTALLGPP